MYGVKRSANHDSFLSLRTPISFSNKSTYGRQSNHSSGNRAPKPLLYRHLPNWVCSTASYLMRSESCLFSPGMRWSRNAVIHSACVYPIIVVAGLRYAPAKAKVRRSTNAGGTMKRYSRYGSGATAFLDVARGTWYLGPGWCCSFGLVAKICVFAREMWSCTAVVV
jgi:hypothetical protein